MNLFIPKRVIQEGFLNNNIGLKKDCLAYILHTIILKGLYNSTDDDNLIGGEWNAQKMKEMVGNKYLNHLNFLRNLSLGTEGLLLETDNQYIVGEKSKAYYLNQAVLSEGFTTYEVKPSALYRKLFKANFKKRSCDSKVLAQFDFDHQKASDKLNQLISSNGKFKLHCQHLLIENIKEQKYWYFRDRKTGRLHHPFTCLKKELREYISYKNQPLVSIDLKNSQPFLLAALITMSANPKVSCNNKLFAEYADQLRVFQVDINSRTFKKFVVQVVNGQLYESILLKLHSTKNVGYTRDQVKKWFMKLLFSKRFYDTHFNRIVREEYPEIIDFITLFKENDYKMLSIFLQKIEAELFVNLISEEIRKKITPVFFSIHDSFYFQEEHLDEITILAEKIIVKMTGINPQFNVSR